MDYAETAVRLLLFGVSQRKEHIASRYSMEYAEDAVLLLTAMLFDVSQRKAHIASTVCVPSIHW